MVPIFVKAGFRVICPDLVGFGKSDKPTNCSDYSYERHVRWMTDFVQVLDLTGMTLVCQDWGSLIGFRVLCAEPDRFARAVGANAGLPGPTFPTRESVLAEDGTFGGSHTAAQTFKMWLKLRLVMPSWAMMLKNTSQRGKNGNPGEQLTDAEAEAYEAPFPDESYKAGSREFPGCVPICDDMPSTKENAAAWEVLKQFNKPFLTAWGDLDSVFPFPESANLLIAYLPDYRNCLQRRLLLIFRRWSRLKVDCQNLLSLAGRPTWNDSSPQGVKHHRIWLHICQESF